MGMQDAKPWDRILAPATALGSVIPLIVVGLDKLYGWTNPFGINIKIAALIVVVLGYALGSWALLENRFFSGVVRIQTDRGHHVVTTGPYRFVRHPGYAGALWTYPAAPIPGNSGGPLVNMSGEVIGITSVKVVASEV